MIYDSEKEQNQQTKLPTDEKSTAFVEETQISNDTASAYHERKIEPEREKESFLTYSSPELADHNYKLPHDLAETVPDALNTSREIRFLISAGNPTDQVMGSLGKARYYIVRVSELKQKRKRNDHLKHLKVAFAVPQETPSCG